MKHIARYAAIAFLGFMIGSVIADIGEILPEITLTMWLALKIIISHIAIMVIGYNAGSEREKDQPRPRPDFSFSYQEKKSND